MKQFLPSAILLLLSFSSFAQDWAHYEPLKSRGEIPADFTEAYTNKYQREREHISQNKKRKARQTEDDFHRRSEYFIDELLVSGDVVFGDSITEYCNSILDLLLKDKPALRKKLRIYVVKTPGVNALATANGIIFVNLGLIAQMENEAQLAFVLSHEIIHYEENHVLNQYVEEERIRNGEDLYRGSDYSDKLTALSTYSKAQELEADKEGYNRYFKNSGYSQQAPLFVMDVLQYSYLPFDELKFEPSFLEKGNFHIPEDYLLKETAPITANADYDDSKSTHPNIKTRKLELLGQLSNQHDGRQYQISEASFKYCQRLARYEIARLLLNSGNYAEAIYHTFLLSQKYGIDRYQRLTVAKALTNSAIYRNDNELYKVTTNYKKVEGESQQTQYLLSRFNKKDLNTLAVAYTYDLLRDFPQDPAVNRLFNRSLHDLVFVNEMHPSDYEREKRDTNTEDLLSIQDSLNATRSSKIKHIKHKRLAEKVVSEENYYLYAFVGFWKDTTFTNRFNEMEERASDARRNGYDPSGVTTTHSKYDKNYALGIDRVVCVTPMYLKLDERAKDGIKYLSSDEKLEHYRQQLLELSDKVDLDMEMLDYKNIYPKEVDKFNDISLFKSWIQERINHENVDAIVSDFDYMQELRKKYNTDYIAYTGNLSLRVREQNVAGKIIYSVILYPLLPFTIADLIIPDYQSFNYFFLFDLRNGNALLAEYNYYETNDGDDYVRSIIYNHLIQIKEKPKK